MDKILYNGKVYTANSKDDFVQAIAIDKNRIKSIGSNEDILNLKDSDTKLIDLKGKLLLPGFIDSHLHYLKYCKNKRNVDLRGTKSISEIINRMKAYIKSNKISEGDWVIGVNWNQDLFDEKEEKRFPNRFDLDKISEKHNIVLIRTCYHIFSVNTKTLKTANIDKNTVQPEDGEFLLDELGNPNGVFCEGAIALIQDAKAPMDKEELVDILKLGSIDLAKCGITSIHTDDLGEDVESIYDVIEAYNILEKNNYLNTRVYKQCRINDYNNIKNFIERGYITGKGNEKFKIGPLKLMLDGSLGARTAALKEPYKDDISTKGILIYDSSDLLEIVKLCHKSNMQIAMHAIGDKAIDQALYCLENSIEEDGDLSLRHGIIHFQITTEEFIDRIKYIDGTVYAQPVFTDYDWNMVHNRVNKELEETSYSWKTIYDKGINICSSSDAPVESFDVLDGIYHAVSMKDKQGNPYNSWKPKQRLTIEEAIKTFTINGAKASFEEDIKGSIEVGKLADMVVLSKDIFKCKEEEILKTEVDMTIFDGKIVYKR